VYLRWQIAACNEVVGGAEVRSNPHRGCVGCGISCKIGVGPCLYYGMIMGGVKAELFVIFFGDGT
jgi:hypothetical protein